jgi:transposase
MAVRRLRHGQGALQGGASGPNPTDRAKPGTKRSVLTEGGGWPLAVHIAGANIHDTRLLQDTPDAVVVEPPNPLRRRQHLCLDKGYDNPTGEAAALVYGYVPHIRRIGEEKLDRRGRRRFPARRWVAESCLSWWNGCRSILVRWARKSPNDLAYIQLDSALLCYRRLQLRTCVLG